MGTMEVEQCVYGNLEKLQRQWYECNPQSVETKKMFN